LITSEGKLGKCYQAQDPTSEDFSELLATDGGVIEVPEIANVVHLVSSGKFLFVFATNGIWKVSGSEGVGFTAVDFAVNKESGIDCSDNKSYVDLSGIPAWINGDGIWVLQADETLGSVRVTSLSKDTIQTWFQDNIPAQSIPFIQGVYNPRERLVTWLFRSTPASSTDEQYEYDYILVFNTETGAFYPWRLNTDSDIKVISMQVVKGFSEVGEEVEVLVSNLDDVVDSVAADVTADVLSNVSLAGTLKLLTEDTSDKVTWAEEADGDYLDWTTAKGTGKDYDSYFMTGYKVRGGGLKKQKTNYIKVHSRIETNSSVQIQGVWDYYGSDGARWTSKQQGYLTAVGTETYSSRRLKIRGNGLALQLLFTSDQGKPFNITGWASEDSTNTKP
jgi:hypothetical protein